MTRRPGAVAALCALLAVVVLAGCGIASDDAPRDIPRAALPESLRGTTATTVPTEPGAARLETVYLVRSDGGVAGESLEPVVVSVGDSGQREAIPRAVVEALVNARPDALGRSDLINAIPPNMEVRAADVRSGGVLDLDLTELATVEGSLQRLAVAQLVFSLTQLVEPRVDAVRFLVDGQPVAVPVERGTAPAGQPVSRADDPTMLSTLRARTPTSR